MRFKAKLATNQVQLLYDIIGPISRLASSTDTNISTSVSSITNTSIITGVGGGGTVLYIDPDNIRISTRGRGEDGIACFAEMKTKDGIFNDHRIESVAKNVIVFEIDLSQLRTALQSVLSGNTGSSSGGLKIGNKRKRQQSQPNEYQQQQQVPLYNSSRSQQNQQQQQQQQVEVEPLVVSSSMTVIKLAKRNGGLPCLCIDASCHTSSDQTGAVVEVHHAIPVRIMRSSEMQYHLPPRINMPDVQLELPIDRPLRTIVERLRAISPHVFIEGSMIGELTLRIDGDGASIRTFFSKLIPRYEDCKETNDDEDGDNNNKKNHSGPPRCILKVDTKKLCSCLQWQQSNMTSSSSSGYGGSSTSSRDVSSALLCMVKNEMLVLHIMLNPDDIGFFTYYIPVHYLSPDDEDVVDGGYL